MNKLLLLCITLFAISQNANGQTTAVEIRERSVGGLNTCGTFTITGSVSDATDGTYSYLPTTTSGSGTGAVLKVVVSSNAIAANDITVVKAGSGYADGDTLTVAKELISATSDFTLTLAAGDSDTNKDIADGSVICHALDVNEEVTNPTDANEANDAVLSITSGVTTSGSGINIQVDLTMSSDGTTVDACTVTVAGTGYKVGDTITVPAAKFTTADGTTTDYTIRLTAADIQDLGKLTKTGLFRDSEGTIKTWSASTKTGYYTTLSKHANEIQVKASFSGTLIPELGGVTDTTFVSSATVYGSQRFPVSDGLNILKLVDSNAGTYEINLIKPDDNVKAIKTSKRSVEISYNPGAVGEFTCSAFADGSGLPTTRTNVKTGTGSVAKSVRTHNILPENRYNSVQMTLNGLTPSTIYDIHCFHLSHGIISNTAASVETDLASLTGVSIAASDKSGAFAASATVTITFTHEKSLGSGDTITLSLYTDFDTKQEITDADATVTDCSALVAITSNGNGVAVTSCAETGTDDLLITLSGTSTVTGTSGNVMIITLTDGTALQFADNAAAGAVVTFDLDVSGHGKLLQQDGWVTE